MSTFKKVLVAVDLEEDSAAYVLESAKQLAPDVPIDVVHVLERSNFYNFGDPTLALIGDLHERIVAEVSEYLGKLCERFNVQDFQLLEGHAATLIQRHAEEHGHDLVVLGTHGRHGIRLLLGSTANAVLHGTHCNVLAVRVPGEGFEVKPAAHKYGRVLAAVDLSAETDQVLDVAEMVSSQENATLNIGHVIKPFQHAYAGINPTTLSDVGLQFEHEADQQARARLAVLASERGLKEDATLVRHGAPAVEIHDMVTELGCDMLVVGTHGKHGVSLLLGSTANAVIHGANCDVLAVRIR
jgi:universal stress protein A